MNDQQRVDGLASITTAAGARGIHLVEAEAGTSHWVQWERAGEFNAVTTAFLSQQDSGAIIR